MKTQKNSNRLLSICCVALFLLALPVSAQLGAAQVRLKDLVRIQGVERIDLVGYGVVVGLNKTGDKDIELAKRTVSNLMKNFNIFIDSSDISSKNVAVVMVTASVEPFHRRGDRVGIQVASMGDATSLQGGILLMTPLLDPDGKTYAIAQGALVVGGYSAGVGGPGGSTETKNFPTVGRIPNGATLKFDHDVEFIKEGKLELVLRQPDFTTAQRIAEVVSSVSHNGSVAEDAGTVRITIPKDVLEVGLTSQFISTIESLRVTPDRRARVVVNERTGTVVLGGEVMISTAIVAHGNLTVRVGSTQGVSQPGAFSRVGETAVIEDVQTEVVDEPAKIMVVPRTTSVQELADVLNQLGASPRDLISILDALQNLGALQMELITL
ncbi:flagellar basal body P-ring protein FlgI [Pontiella agarivorans]|uniref:Flagellar P-ring protein n=1 Tax=Pontiella agarivorans TaxID=3038953 RepID=A0ABU5MT00_9BACT|nr:flagellar basal body P-ring protein FlgI [Pontiella agarivorans]MDZ8117300.1 flagellar basal body P-ring protein FlgI [Pontiella agarivorans]